MRIDKVETKVYPFSELTDEAKQTALEKLYDINVDYDWWEFTYEDAANVGIKITEFDIDRGSFCHGDFTLDAEDVAKKIIEEHGIACETHSTAANFINDVATGKAIHESDENYDPDYMEWDETSEYEELVAEFERSILEDYRIILQHEFEYLTGEEAILETIEANEYEFTEDGKLY